MRSDLGKRLSKKEMREVQGGKLPGCAAQGQNGIAYSQGCCTGLILCTVNHLCEPAGGCPPCQDC
jgi:hypothetical protein